MQLELLAIHDSVMHFRNLILGKKIHLRTDSKALTQYVHLEKQPNIVARWLMDLSEFDIKSEHVSGSDNPADYISRHILNIDFSKLDEQNIFSVEMKLSEENIEKEQSLDVKLSNIIKKLKTTKPKNITRKYYLLNDKILVLKNNNNNYENPLYVTPYTLRETVMNAAHSPHFSFLKTYQFIKDRFFWIGMYKDVKYWCEKCIQCNQHKPHKTIEIPIQKMNKEYKIGEALHIDVAGRLPRSLNGNNYIFLIIDTFSRFLQAIPIPNTETRTLLKVLNAYFGRYGIARLINADNAKYFQSNEFKNYMQNLNITLRFSSIYRPCGNALIERCIRTLKESVSAMAQGTFLWDTRLHFFTLMYNNSKHRATGYKPAYLFFGRELNTPFTNFGQPKLATYTEYTKSIREHISVVQKDALKNMNQAMEEYNKHKTNKHRKLNIGDTVYLRAFRKPGAFQKKNLGPYKIVRAFRNDNYLIELLDNGEGRKLLKIHISKIFTRPYDYHMHQSQTNTNTA